MNRSGTSWQLILADLALILFLVSLIALIGRKDARAEAETRLERRGERSEAASAYAAPRPQLTAPAAGVYRASAKSPPLGEWLAGQTLDPRAVLTIHARHTRGEEAAAWAAARALAREARAAPVRLRIVTEEAMVNDLSATLAYDGEPANAKLLGSAAL